MPRPGRHSGCASPRPILSNSVIRGTGGRTLHVSIKQRSILSTIVISTLPNITLHARVAEQPAVAYRCLPGHKLSSPSERFASGCLCVTSNGIWQNGGHDIVSAIKVGG